MPRTRPILALCLAAIFLVAFCGWLWQVHRSRPDTTSAVGDQAPEKPLPVNPAAANSPVTTLWAHNIRLRKGPAFRIYINWIRGEMRATNSSIVPSLNDANSFELFIQKGVVHANLGDFGNYLNTAVPSSFPLKKIKVSAAGSQIRLAGTLHKLLVPIPVELLCNVAPASRGRTVLHVTRINVLKLPMKGLLGGFHIEVDDVLGKDPVPGIEVSGNDIFFDTAVLLPPPHISGQLTSTIVESPDIVLIYGNSKDDQTSLEQWHNFLRLSGGTLGFGSLVMHPADLTLIDASKDVWFDLDLIHYQAQLLKGFSRITAESGLEMFMPSLDEQRHTKPSPSLDVDWLRNRNQSLPSDVPVH